MKNGLKSHMPRLLRLFLGLGVFSVAIALTLNANLGVAPWDTFHSGLSKVLHISFGNASIMVGLLFVAINYFLKEKIGIGTIANMLVIGALLDVIFAYHLIPYATNLLDGLMMIGLAMVLISFASYLYIGAGYGTGPRDGFMIAMLKRTSFSVGQIRAAMELSVLALGVLMGGRVGLGTLVLAFGIGPVVQYFFRLVKFDVKTVKHQYLG